MHKKLLLHVLLFLLAAIVSSCHTDNFLKRDAYPRINFPQSNGYIIYNEPECPFTFELPDYFTINRNITFFKEEPENPCWMNLENKNLNATIYLSYKSLETGQTLQKLVEDTYRLTYKHSNRADFIEPQEIENGHGARGLIYYVGGDAASNFQFFVTDTITNFVRGALYFYSRPNADSLKPVIDFMIKDIETMLVSWRWK